jgi:hypothetical protein
VPELWPVLRARVRGEQGKSAGEQKHQKIRGKIKNVGAPTFSTGGVLPCFCVCRGNKRVACRNLVSRENKRLRNQANWSDKKTGTPPAPGYPVCAGMVGLTRGARKCGNDWTWEIFGEGEETRRVERENSPREHEALSQFIATSSTVLCSTGTILRRKGNGKNINGKVDSRQFKAKKMLPQGPGTKHRNLGHPATDVFCGRTMASTQSPRATGIAADRNLWRRVILRCRIFWFQNYSARGYSPIDPQDVRSMLFAGAVRDSVYFTNPICEIPL